MSITQEKKTTLISEFAISEQDTGSAQVQCSILTERINNLTAHMKANPKDAHSKRGLLVLVGRRRRLLRYLQKRNHSNYLELIKRLGLRK